MSLNTLWRKATTTLAVAVALSGITMATAPAAMADGDYCGHRVLGDIEARYLDMGGPSGSLGCPLTEELVNPDGFGRRTQFEHGTIYWSPQTGAWPVWGWIGDGWCQLGCERGIMKYPISKEFTGSVEGKPGIAQNFQCGQLFVLPPDPTVHVHYICD